MIRQLVRSRSGAAAAEFAIVVPVLIMVLFAILQFGMLFFANAGVQNAVGEGARMATLWPRRTQAQITSEITASRFGVNPNQLSAPVFNYGRAGGQDFVEITLSYEAEMEFLFFEVPTVTLTHTRRAYLP